MFEDGDLTFEEIYVLYNAYFKGHYLYVVTDCCYSGAWVVECARLLDRDGVGCGHAAKRKQVFIKVFASCLPNEAAYDKFYTMCKGVRSCRNNMYTRTMRFAKHKKISHDGFSQTTLGMDFTQEAVCIIDYLGICHPLHTWTWHVQNLIYEGVSDEYCV